MKETRKQKIIAIVGPTASGKTGLSVQLAEKYNGEIISADSRQVYRGLDVGTEKIMYEEMNGIPHHLIDVCDPNEVFTVTDFKTLANRTISEIISRHNVPIIVGGTGFYVDALLYDQDFPEVPPNEALRARFGALRTDELYALLQQQDPERAGTIDPCNKRRLVRALEIIEMLGKVPSNEHKEPPYEVLLIGIETEDEILKERIRTRLEHALKRGLVEEVKKLRETLPDTRIQEFGLEYRAILRYLNEELSLEEAREQMVTELWHYVKRQHTWFKRNNDIQWYTLEQLPKIEEQVEGFLKKV